MRAIDSHLHAFRNERIGVISQGGEKLGWAEDLPPARRGELERVTSRNALRVFGLSDTA